MSRSFRIVNSIDIDSTRALAAMAAGNSLGILALYLIPLNIAAATEGFGVREGTAGIVSSCELGAMAIASLLTAARLQRLNARCWSVLAVGVVVVANLASVWSMTAGDWIPFVASRGVVGIGEGVLLALTNGLGARTARPDRTFAFFSGFQVLLAGSSLLGVGVLMERIGPTGAFVAAACISGVLLLLILWTPAVASARAGSDAKTERAVEVAAPSLSLLSRTALTLLGGVALFNLALSTLYPYSERIGAAIGLSLASVGVVLSIGAWLAVLGPIACGLTGTRFGRTFPLALGLGLEIIGALVLVYTTSHAWWAIAQIVTAMALLYCYPFLNGMIAVYDPTGRLNAASATTMSMMSALGPLAGGLVLNLVGGFVMLGWLSAIGYAVALAVLYRPLRAADRML